MPPKKSESLKFIKIGDAISQGLHDGLNHLYPLEEAEEDPVWAEENPYIKRSTEPSVFTDTMDIDPAITKSLTALAEACKEAAEALGKSILAAANCLNIWTQKVSAEEGPLKPFFQSIRAMEVQKALNEAPSRVRHLAKHSKKHRTRKKNLNRAMREYQRRKK